MRWVDILISILDDVSLLISCIFVLRIHLQLIKQPPLSLTIYLSSLNMPFLTWDMPSTLNQLRPSTHCSCLCARRVAIIVHTKLYLGEFTRVRRFRIAHVNFLHQIDIYKFFSIDASHIGQKIIPDQALPPTWIIQAKGRKRTWRLRTAGWGSLKMEPCVVIFSTACC